MESQQPYAIFKPSWCQRSFSRITPGSLRGSIFTLCASAIGAGLLSLPYAVNQCGLILGILMLIIGGLCFGVYYLILVAVCDDQQIYDFVAVTVKLYGEAGRRLTEVSVTILCFGTVAAYMVLVSSFLTSVLESFGVIGVGDIDTARVVIILALTVCVWLPLSLPKEITSLSYFSLLSVVGILYITILVLFQSPVYISENPEFSQQIEFFKLNKNILNAVGITFFAYDAVQNVPIIYSELQRPSKVRMTKVVFRTIALLAFLYIILGVSGYLSYLDQMPDLVVFRTPLGGGSSAYDWPMVVARVMVCLYLTVAVVLNFYPLRLSMEQFIAGSDLTPSPFRYYSLTVILLGLAAAVAIVVPDAVFYFKVLGGIFAAELSFVLPAMLYWKISNNTTKKLVVSGVAAVLMALGLACAVDSIIQLVQ